MRGTRSLDYHGVPYARESVVDNGNGSVIGISKESEVKFATP